MAEKKEGFFKRLFRFGKKKREDESVDDGQSVDLEQRQLDADNAEQEKRELEAQKLKEQEDQEEARQLAEAQRLREEQDRKKLDEEEAAERIRQDFEEERRQAEKKARLEAEEFARQETAERARQEHEERARQEADEEARRADEEKRSDEIRQAEQQKLDAERKVAAAAEAEARAEAQRLADDAQKAAGEERERLGAEQAEAERRTAEMAEAERLAAEQERLAREQADAERAAAEEDARQAKIQAERLAAEQIEREAAAKVEQEAQAEVQRITEEAERAEQEKLEVERLTAEKAKREEHEAAARDADEERNRLAEAERVAAEQADAEQADAERLAKEVADREAIDPLADPAPDQSPAPVENDSPEPAQTTPTAKKSWFSRLKDGLSRSSNQISESITSVFTKRKLDEESLQELEDILIQADLGVETAMNITDALASQRMGKDVTDEEVRSFMAEEIEKVLEPVAAELELDLDHRPHVILVVGVNGSGKTTTIGKLSQKLFDGGYSTLLVAGDTFRAAAIEQLKIWGDRTQSPVVSRPLGSDAAGLAFDAFEQARTGGHDVMLMDTAGRLQNKKELMDELEKIIRVLKKQDPSAPHTVLLTLDATTGQNALNQVEIFEKIAGVNGLVMTKLDGTARGGIMVAIAAKHKLPVYFIGVGEQVDDLEPFEARDFARSIAGLED